jgi:hypothetical protein
MLAYDRADPEHRPVTDFESGIFPSGVTW